MIQNPFYTFKCCCCFCEKKKKGWNLATNLHDNNNNNTTPPPLSDHVHNLPHAEQAAGPDGDNMCVSELPPFPRRRRRFSRRTISPFERRGHAGRTRLLFVFENDI